jgi:DNA processing protein
VLFERVRRSGLLMSESGFGVRADLWRFPVRNRIIAALADVIVVVEATLHDSPNEV